MGHIIRSIELAGTLQRKGITVCAFTCNDDDYCQQLIRSEGFLCIPTRQDVSDAVAAQNLAQIIGLEKIDILILDHPGDFSHLCRVLKEILPSLFIVALDHFDMTNEYIDIIVNLLNHNLTLQTPTSDQVRYYEGIQYGIIRTNFKAYIDRERSIRSQVKDVLVSFGGGDPKHNTLTVIQALSQCFPLQAAFHFVQGANFAHQEIVRQRVRHLEVETRLYQDIANIEELMYRCDIGLCGAGTTMMEMACLGTPMIILAQSEEEARFADAFTQHGAVKNLGLIEKASAPRVRDAIIDLAQDPTTRQRMSTAGKTLVDGQGCERIAELIIRDYGLSRREYG